MTQWDGVPPNAWGPRECVVRMVRGVIAKVQRLERDGVLTAKGSDAIRDALAAAIVEAGDARWSRPHPDAGVEVIGSVPPPAPLPLPTESSRMREGWWLGRI